MRLGIDSEAGWIHCTKICVYTVALLGGETKRSFGGVGFLFLIYARGLLICLLQIMSSLNRSETINLASCQVCVVQIAILSSGHLYRYS
jgi:hypothetical protein